MIVSYAQVSDIKFNQRYCAIQTKSNNICALKERNGLIRIELPSFRKKDEPPESDLNWNWSESQSFWQANFMPTEMPSANTIKHLLAKSLEQIEKKRSEAAIQANTTRKLKASAS